MEKGFGIFEDPGYSGNEKDTGHVQGFDGGQLLSAKRLPISPHRCPGAP